MLVFLVFLACANSDDNETTVAPPSLTASDDTANTDVIVDTGNAGVTLTVGEPVPRVVLHEAFSGSNCGPCEPAAENLKVALDGKQGQYGMLKYQIGSDPYITPEAVQQRMFYLPAETETYGIPWVVADGIHQFHPNEMDNDQPYSSKDFEDLVSIPAFLHVSVTASVTNQTVSIDIDLWPSIDFTGEDLRLLVAIKEGTTFNNVGSNGQTEFRDVFKKFVPNRSGTTLDKLVAGETSSHHFEYTFAGDYDPETSISNPVNHDMAHTVEDFDDLGVLAWVQDMNTLEIFNAGLSANE